MAKTVRNCMFCSKEFVSYNKNPKFCSRICKDTSQKHNVSFDKIVDLYERGHTQEEVAAILGTTQKVVFERMRNAGYKARVAAKRDQRGAKNSFWKGGRVYDGRGYVLVKTPNHPRARKSGDYVREHILVVEKYIGRFLNETEYIHHINGIKDDNRPENLYITNAVEHTWLHSNNVAHLVTSNLSEYKEMVERASI